MTVQQSGLHHTKSYSNASNDCGLTAECSNQRVWLLASQQAAASLSNKVSQYVCEPFLLQLLPAASLQVEVDIESQDPDLLLTLLSLTAHKVSKKNTRCLSFSFHVSLDTLSHLSSPLWLQVSS